MTGGGGSSGNQTSFVQSPEQETIWNAFRPALKGFKKFFKSGENLWDLPELPKFPSHMIPDISTMMPKEGWWSGLDSGIRAGIMEPWREGENQLYEKLGSMGMLGSARGGASGAAGRAGAEYWATQAMPQIQAQGWGMVAPALQAGWKEKVGEAEATWGSLMNQYQQQLQQQSWPWQAIQGLLGYGLPTPIVQQGQGNQWSGMAGLLGGSFLGNLGSAAGGYAGKKIFG